MFNKQALKILARENARLRGELRRKEKQVSELLDNFIFHKIPERLANRNFSASPSGMAGTGSAHIPAEHIGDAYSAVIAELEREIDNAEPTYTIAIPEEDTDD